MRAVKKFAQLGLVCFLVSGVSAFGAGAAAPNLLRDSSFEDTASVWQLMGTANITSQEARTGSKSLSFKGDRNPQAKDNDACGYRGVSGLKPGQFYRVDVWVKTKGLPQDRPVVVGPYLDGIGTFPTNQDDHDWELVTGYFQAKDSNPSRVYLLGRTGYLPDQTGPAGEVFFDDVSLRECADPLLNPVTFEDGTMLGIGYVQNPSSVARVVKMKTPLGGSYCLFVAPASCTLSLPKPVTSGRAEFSFLINLKGSGRIRVGNTLSLALRLDFLPNLLNYEDKAGTVVGTSLGPVSPDRWYRVRGIINLDSQTYDLEVTDYEDSLGSFTRKGLHFFRPMKEVNFMYIEGNAKEGVFYDDIYLGPVRANQ